MFIHGTKIAKQTLYPIEIICGGIVQSVPSTVVKALIQVNSV